MLHSLLVTQRRGVPRTRHAIDEENAISDVGRSGWRTALRFIWRRVAEPTSVCLRIRPRRDAFASVTEGVAGEEVPGAPGNPY